jgi:hypothetical protein
MINRCSSQSSRSKRSVVGQQSSEAHIAQPGMWLEYIFGHDRLRSAEHGRTQRVRPLSRWGRNDPVGWQHHRRRQPAWQAQYERFGSNAAACAVALAEE